MLLQQLQQPHPAPGHLSLLLYPWEIFVGGLILALNVVLVLLWLSRGIFFLFLLRTSPDTQAADGLDGFEGIILEGSQSKGGGMMGLAKDEN